MNRNRILILIQNHLKRSAIIANNCTSKNILSNKPYHSHHYHHRPEHYYFSTLTRGQDLLADALTHTGSGSGNGSSSWKRKIILDSYYPKVGIDVIGMVEYNTDIMMIMQQNDDNTPTEDTTTTNNNNNDEENEDAMTKIAKRKMQQFNNTQNHQYQQTEQPQNLLMNSSIIAFPNSCFLWHNISKPKHVTLESLTIIQLLKPSIEFLFIGCDEPLPPRQLNVIKRSMKDMYGIVVEQMDVMNAMGTFNILNGEDRRVAVALVVDVDDDGMMKENGK